MSDSQLLYREYLRRLDVRAVLEHYGAENCSEVGNADGTTEIVHSCLLDRVEPHHANGDSHPSASVNVEKKVYICYSYWGGNLFHLIAKLEQCDVSEVAPRVNDLLEGATKTADGFKEEVERMFSDDPVYLFDLPSYSDKVLEPWATCHPYMFEDRGISIEAMTRLRIGFDQRENRIVFPHWWGERLVGWQKRSIPGRDGQWPGTYPPQPKYRNSISFPKSETLYGYDLVDDYTGPVVVVESPMSVARAIHHRLPGVVATFGAKVSQTQIELLTHFNQVVVWFDDDPAGQAGARKLVQGLYRHTDVRVVNPDPGMDLADYPTVEDVIGRIHSAVLAVDKLAQWELEGVIRGG